MPIATEFAVRLDPDEVAAVGQKLRGLVALRKLQERRVERSDEGSDSRTAEKARSAEWTRERSCQNKRKK